MPRDLAQSTCPWPVSADSHRISASMLFVLPAKIQERPCRGRDSLVIPTQEVELGHCASLVGLQVLQVKAPHQEVLAPDMLRDQIDLVGTGEQSV